MITEIKFNERTIEVSGGQAELIFALFLDQRSEFPFISSAFESWKVALTCGLTVDLGDYITSPVEQENFVALIKATLGKLKSLPEFLDIKMLNSIVKTLYSANNWYTKSVETAQLISTLRRIQDLISTSY